MFLLESTQWCDLLVLTVPGARMTVRIEAAKDDIARTEGGVCLGAIGEQWRFRDGLTTLRSDFAREEKAQKLVLV